MLLQLAYNLVLGSKSPRRVELLQKSGLDFEQRVIDTDESYPKDLSVDTIAQHIAEAKAAAHKTTLTNQELLITADTIVVHNNVVYGKPKTEEDALQTLTKLSGTKHLVYTGVCLMTTKSLSAFSVKSEVHFATLSEKEIKWYINEFEPYDKAGAYGIQDWIGNVKINSIVGSYTNILGLPMGQLYTALEGFS